MSEGKGRLYLCATPIGNLEDITLRALRVLREVDLIAAEDTRHTRKLLSHYDIHTPLTSYHDHNRRKKGGEIVGHLLAGKQVALVSDAGLPGISDPGAELVGQALERGVMVVPIPGPSASVTALVVSGLPTDAFVFEGFLPAAGKRRRKSLALLKEERRTLIFYESPHRLLSTLTDMLAVFGDRPLAVARELTKRYEEVVRETIAGALRFFQEHEPRGEFTLVVGGRTPPESGEEESAREKLAPAELVAFLEADGMARPEAIREAARRLGQPKRAVYREVILNQERET